MKTTADYSTLLSKNLAHGRLLSTSLFVAATACLLLIVVASNGFAQKQRSKPDLSGAWLLDAKKGNSVGMTSRPDLPIKISHQDPELRTTLTSESARLIEFELVDEWKLSPDGKILTQRTRTVYLQSPGGTFLPAMAPDKKRVYNRV